MARNMEIKARVLDRNTLIEKALALNPHEQFELYQKDTFFNTPQGRLKLRQFKDGSAELIFYHRPDQAGPKLSTYSRCPVTNADELAKTLEQAYGIRGAVEKIRNVYLVGQTRIHVDQVTNLGNFMELEVVLEDHETLEHGEKIAKELLQALDIDQSQLIEGAYMDLLQAL